MTLLVRDEDDILRSHLEYHLARGVDEILLMDNLSEDGTAEIAREYERAGVLRYTSQTEDDYDQGDWVSELANRAGAEMNADWIINSDADEFWCPNSGSLKDALGEARSDVQVARVERTNFVTRDETSEPFWKRMDARYSISRNALGERLSAKIAHRAATSVLVAQGNHAITISGASPVSDFAPITILHYPIRSRTQFQNKIAKGGAAYERNAHLEPSIGRTWRYLYELYLEGRLDEAYDREVLSDAQVDLGVAAGSLVHDDRLANALETLHASHLR